MAVRRARSTSHSTVAVLEMPKQPAKDSHANPIGWRLQSQRLLSWHEIPAWQQDNEFILTGYRPTSGSVRISFASLRYVNNQTINAYSHLLGSVLFAALPFYFYTYVYKTHPNGHVADIVVISTYCLGVAVCFAFSATFHILWNHSAPVYSYWNKLDYLGILVLMWGAGVPTIFYGFYCDHSLRILYWATTSITAVACAVLTLDPHFAKPKFRHWRACFYAGFGLSSLLFVAHGLYIYGWESQKSRMSLVWMIWMACSNLIGAIVYAIRIPERLYPCVFDICGASHQIFHVAVMIAAWIHFAGLLEAFRVIRSDPSTCLNA